MAADDEILYRPVLAADTHLGDSHRTEGYKASTVYSDEDNSTVDIAEWEPVYPSEDDDEESTVLDGTTLAIGALIGAAATALAALGIHKAKPHVRKIIDEHVAPRASAAAAAIKEKLGISKSEVRDAPNEIVVVNPEPQMSEQSEENAGIVLTEEQAGQLLMSAFHDYLMYAAKMRLLNHAEIKSRDRRDLLKLEQAKSFLLSSEGLEKINLYLEANPQWFTNETERLFVGLYGRDPLDQGRYLPITREEFEGSPLGDTSEASDGLVISAHDACTANRLALQRSKSCGCFYCLSVYSPSEIAEWVEDQGGDTAICPHCGIDSVIPGESGYPLTKEFLQKMNEHWF